MKKAIKFEQIVIMVYERIDEQIEKYNQKALKLALGSFDGRYGTEKQINNVLKVCSKRNALKDLKWKINLILSMLPKDEVRLILSGGNRVVAINYGDYSARTFYRKRKRAFDHFGEMLSYIKLDEANFYALYGHDAVVQSSIKDYYDNLRLVRKVA